MWDGGLRPGKRVSRRLKHWTTVNEGVRLVKMVGGELSSMKMVGEGLIPGN